MKNSDLVFIGIKGSVVALNAANGQQAWTTHLKGSSFVNVVVQNEVVLASCEGEIFCLDSLTGNVLWHNPLTGFGLGLATIATEQNPGSVKLAAVAEQHHRDEQHAASTGTHIGVASSWAVSLPSLAVVLLARVAGGNWRL